MLDRRILYGIVVIIITVSILALAVNIPLKPSSCVSNDGQCPQGCTYDKDTDCIKSTITTSGEIRRCLADVNCVIATPICGDESCNFNDIECKRGCSCGVAINKDYKTVFEAANVKCLPSGETTCIKCPENQSAVCMNGECRIVTL